MKEENGRDRKEDGEFNNNGAGKEMHIVEGTGWEWKCNGLAGTEREWNELDKCGMGLKMNAFPARRGRQY